MKTPSYVDSANAKPFHKPMTAWFAKYALGTVEDSRDPRISLIDANLSGLSPITLINAQVDPLLTDAEMLETSLKKAGVKVEHEVNLGTTHEFFGWLPLYQIRKNLQHWPENVGVRLS